MAAVEAKRSTETSHFPFFDNVCNTEENLILCMHYFAKTFVLQNEKTSSCYNLPVLTKWKWQARMGFSYEIAPLDARKMSHPVMYIPRLNAVAIKYLVQQGSEKVQRITLFELGKVRASDRVETEKYIPGDPCSSYVFKVTDKLVCDEGRDIETHLRAYYPTSRNPSPLSKTRIFTWEGRLFFQCEGMRSVIHNLIRPIFSGEGDCTRLPFVAGENWVSTLSDKVLEWTQLKHPLMTLREKDDVIALVFNRRVGTVQKVSVFALRPGFKCFHKEDHYPLSQMPTSSYFEMTHILDCINAKEISDYIKDPANKQAVESLRSNLP